MEDALKGKFISLYDCIASRDEVIEYIVKELNDCKELKNSKIYDKDEVVKIFKRIFNAPLNIDKFEEVYKRDGENSREDFEVVVRFNELLNEFNNNGYDRVNLTSSLIAKFINGIYYDESEDISPTMKLKMKKEIKEEVEVLKHFTYKTLISSNLLKIPEHRGYEIVKTIFNVLQKPEGYLLLPDDYRDIYCRFENENEKKRVICDFIAGMTDRYGLEFYGRLKSENPQSIFKPI